MLPSLLLLGPAPLSRVNRPPQLRLRPQLTSLLANKLQPRLLLPKLKMSLTMLKMKSIELKLF